MPSSGLDALRRAKNREHGPHPPGAVARAGDGLARAWAKVSLPAGTSTCRPREPPRAARGNLHTLLADFRFVECRWHQQQELRALERRSDHREPETKTSPVVGPRDVILSSPLTGELKDAPDSVPGRD